MASYQSSDLLTRFNQLAGRPTSNDSISDAEKYARLADSQDVVINDAAAVVPNAFYSKAATASTPTLTSSDGGHIFTFGNDANGNALFPIGKVRIFENLQAIPDYPWVEGVDYLNEGTQIRMPNNTTWGGTLYWRGIAPPERMSGSVQPTIIPVNFRMLIVFDAVRQLSQEGVRNDALFAAMDRDYQRMFRQFCLVLKTQFSNGGAAGSVSGLRLAMLGSSSLTR